MIKLIPIILDPSRNYIPGKSSSDEPVIVFLMSNYIQYFYKGKNDKIIVIMKNGDIFYTLTPFEEFYENLMGRPYRADI